MRLRLIDGDLAAVIAPEIGGALLSATWRGEDILRPSADGVTDPLETACFPLAPFANRIALGRFAFRRRVIQLEPAPGEAHALHGQAWKRPWRVIAHHRASARLAYEHRPGDGGWPWAYLLRQDIVLESDRIRLGLELTNLDASPMPAGLGFHPFFPIIPETRLLANVSGAWLTSADLLPTVHSAAPGGGGDWVAGVALPLQTHVDNCLTGWDGGARIELGGKAIALHASAELKWLHVYAPLGQPFFCAEPVSHRPDAFNGASPRADGLRILRPGEAWKVDLNLVISTGTSRT